MEKHKIAWTDRIGLNRQWARDIEVCSRAYGTEYFPKAVERFKNNIPNIKDGPPLADIIEQKEKELEEEERKLFHLWELNNPHLAMNDAERRAKVKALEMEKAVKLYRFILQTLEDNGFIFYKSSVVEDEME